MSVARPAKCLFCTFKQATKPSKPSGRIARQFSTSPVKPYPRSKSGPAKQQREKSVVDEIKPLSEEQINQNYTPEQAQAIKQTQEYLKKSFEDMTSSTAQNLKPWTMTYVQPMTEIDPVLDKAVKAPWTNLDDNSRLKTEDELNEDIMRFMQSMPENENDAQKALHNFLATNRITVGKPEAEFNPRSAIAPQTGKMVKQNLLPGQQPAEAAQKKKGGRGREAEGQDQEVSPALVRLMQMTGYNQRQLSALRVKSILSHRVVNQTRLGKIQKQYWLSVAGNQNGLLGIGEGKSEESAEGMIQSQYRAIRNMVPIMRYENRTIYGDVKGKEGATELELSARPPGFGLRCQQYIYEMCRCAGISDLAARVTRARNPMNTVKAAYQAMQSQKDPEEIAKGRGKKLVDVRKVYYAGNV
ncbi:28S ribosomal protein S5, mitochondrial [Knufia obscura]|uniref:Small ribosomal subunit protein uS5m n=2 Tax=Knufia TaxID=430999 RepID=A0AAN8IAG2_9EURO|nr:28S ribosomal protein S5, mitochondrial [Knufia obscura]KAK5955520.1 28S ribosomal protein S5, mitochondrial [Knufia fluminis]